MIGAVRDIVVQYLIHNRPRGFDEENEHDDDDHRNAMQPVEV
jgi:hypothetical protein